MLLNSFSICTCYNLHRNNFIAALTHTPSSDDVTSLHAGTH